MGLGAAAALGALLAGLVESAGHGDLLRKPPAWTWANEDDELVREGPLLDDAQNLYLVTGYGRVRKFSPNGQLLWVWTNDLPNTHSPLAKISTPAALYNGSIYMICAGGLTALSMETGELQMRAMNWHLASGITEFLNHRLFIHDGVVFVALRDGIGQSLSAGNNKVIAMRASDGEVLWHRHLPSQSQDTVISHFVPTLLGSGTLLLCTPSARMLKLNASDGEILSEVPLPEPMGWQGTGGGALSPDGRFFFALGNYRGHGFGSQPALLKRVPPCNPAGCLFGEGLIIAYRVADGEIMWARRFYRGLGGTTPPAVGFVDGPGSRLAVFAAVGENMQAPILEMGEAYFPPVVRRWIGRLQFRWDWLRQVLQVPNLFNMIFALDAETGAELWKWKEEPWGFRAAAGEEERLSARMQRWLANPRYEPTCRPSAWAVPAVGPDGTVYAASGKTGNLYAMRDANGDGRIEGDEISTFKTRNGFHGQPSLASGLLAAAPCWGSMYVFKS